MSCTDASVSFPDASKAKDLARNWALLYSEICAIQQAILASVSQCGSEGGKFCTTVSGNTPMTFVEEVTGLMLVNGGSGYADLSPITVITDAQGGFGAEAATSVNELGVIDSVELTSGGQGYSVETIATVITDPELPAPTEVAQVMVTVSNNTYGTNPEDYYLSLIGQSDNKVIKDQMDHVMSYFRNLGYSIAAQVNPDTLNSIQWQICW